jgi:hypothetical protein
MKPTDSDWKQDFANDAEAACFHPIVKEVIDEYVDNMRHNYSVDLSKGLPSVGLSKVKMAVALVARAQALDIDPELLRLSNDEADASIIEMARRFHEAGKPVLVVAVDRKDGLCDAMKDRPFPSTHRVQKNEGRRTCVACGGKL